MGFRAIAGPADCRGEDLPDGSGMRLSHRIEHILFGRSMASESTTDG